MNEPWQELMTLALQEAEQAGERGEVPVGAVIAGPDGAVIARAGNRIREMRDPTAHAEMLAIRAAADHLNNERLSGCDLVVTLEPCAMCAGAVSLARLARVVYAAEDPKGGAVLHGPRLFEQPTCHHRPEIVAGPGHGRSATLLRNFFRERR
ncbi:MAG: nucleoside deaminase [Alphaproteobacteria bacterium]